MGDDNANPETNKREAPAWHPETQELGDELRRVWSVPDLPNPRPSRPEDGQTVTRFNWRPSGKMRLLLLRAWPVYSVNTLEDAIWHGALFRIDELGVPMCLVGRGAPEWSSAAALASFYGDLSTMALRLEVEPGAAELFGELAAVLQGDWR